MPLAQPVLAAVPTSGRVEIRGELVDGGAVVPVLPERVLWPAAPVCELDTATALILVTGIPAEDDAADAADGS